MRRGHDAGKGCNPDAGRIPEGNEQSEKKQERNSNGEQIRSFVGHCEEVAGTMLHDRAQHH